MPIPEVLRLRVPALIEVLNASVCSPTMVPMLRHMSPRALPLLLVGGLATPAWADHPRSVVASSSEGAAAAPRANEVLALSPPATAWLVLLVVGTLLIVSIGSRRARAGLIAGLLLFFAFEAAIHSVHHIGDREGQTRCGVAAASSQLSGVLAEPIEMASSAVALGPVPLWPAPVASSRPSRADQQRAPPSLV